MPRVVRTNPLRWPRAYDPATGCSVVWDETGYAYVYYDRHLDAAELAAVRDHWGGWGHVSSVPLLEAIKSVLCADEPDAFLLAIVERLAGRERWAEIMDGLARFQQHVESGAAFL